MENCICVLGLAGLLLKVAIVSLDTYPVDFCGREARSTKQAETRMLYLASQTSATETAVKANVSSAKQRS